MAEDIAGIILAGGLSRRMGGGDKPLGLLGGLPLLSRIVARLKPQVGGLALNANGDPSRFSAYGLPVVPDTVAGFAGPLAGLLAGLEWAASNTAARRIVTVAGDTPFFPTDLVERLAEASKGRPGTIAVASSAGRWHPTFGLWSVDIAASLRHALVERDERRVRGFIESHEHIAADFAFPEVAGIAYDPFFNINTPQDLAEAERLARAMT